MNLVAQKDELFGLLIRQNEHLEALETTVARLLPRQVPLHQTLAWSATSSGWTQLIPSNPNHVCVVWLLAVSRGSVNAYFGQGQSDGSAAGFRSVSSVVGGELALTGNSGFNNGIPWPSAMFTTDEGNGFWIHLDAAIQVDGYVSYFIQPREQGAA